MHTEVTTTFDWPEVPELYVTQTPFLNAGAVGFEEPFIVAGDGTAGYVDGAAAQARFSGPIGVGVDGNGLVLVSGERLVFFEFEISDYELAV